MTDSKPQAKTLDERVHDAELELASRRNLEKVLLVLGSFSFVVLTVAAAVAGFLGYRQLSDFDNYMDSRIEKYYADRELEFKDLEFDTQRVEGLIEQLEPAIALWESTIGPAFDILDGQYALDDDVAGISRDVQTISERCNHIVGVQNECDGWRDKVTVGLVAIAEYVEDSDPNVQIQLDADEIFNLAQVTRLLNRPDLAQKLVQGAYKRDSADPALEALNLELQVAERGDKEAFRELMGMVTGLTMENPHIVAAEAWNAAEELRRYSSLIDAIDELILKHRNDGDVFLPSYVLALKGQAYVRRGLPGDIPRAVEALALAVERLRLEGKSSQWGERTIAMVKSQSNQLRSFSVGVDMSRLDDAVSSSGIYDLQPSWAVGSLPPEFLGR